MGEQLTESDVKKIKEEIEYRKIVVRKKELEAVSHRQLRKHRRLQSRRGHLRKWLLEYQRKFQGYEQLQVS